MKYVFILCFFVPFLTYSQELTVVKKGGKYNPELKTFTYGCKHVSQKDEKWKIVFKWKGNKVTSDLKNFSNTLLDSLYQTGESLIYKSLQHGVTANDTVVGQFHYVWEKAVLRKKDDIKGLEYKLKVIKKLPN